MPTGLRGVIALLVVTSFTATPAPATAQVPAVRSVYLARPWWSEPPATWAIPVRDRVVTIVSSLPAPRVYRICNDSSASVVVDFDAQSVGLAARSCLDLAASTIRIGQDEAGIPARGTYVRLD